MKVGFMLPSLQSIAMNDQLAQAAGSLGVDSLWVPDHLLGFWHPALWPEFPASQVMPDPDAFLDPFIVSAAIGSRTSLPVGLCVTDTVRRKGIDLYRAAMTLHDLCPGGFILGVGSGETESTVPFGYAFEKPVGELARALTEIRSLMDTGTMPGDGPGRSGIDRTGSKGLPEVWVAAQGGPRSLGLAGTYGDGWLSLTYDLERWKAMYTTVRAAAHAAGRPCPIAGAFPVSFIGASRDAIAELVERTPLLKLLLLFADVDLWQRYGVEHPNGPEAAGYHTIPHVLEPSALRELAGRLPLAMFEDFVLMGNADDISERLRPYAEAGLEHVVLADMSSLVAGPEDAARAFQELARLTSILHEQQTPGASQEEDR
jgi:phthiodiolone/phenolphthiodiolone dimycocerosates ketoreductase